LTTVDPAEVRVWFGRQEPEKAMAWVESNGSEKPDWFRVAAWCGISEAARSAGRLEIAEKCTRKARTLAPTDPHALFEDSLVQVARERYGQALELLEAIDRSHTGMWIVSFNRAVCHQRMGQHAKAKELYVSCLERRPDDLASLIGLANCHASLRQWQSADKHLAEACRQDPHSQAAWLSRAYIREAAGDWRGARDCARKALKAENSAGAQFISALLLPAIPESVAQIQEARERLLQRFTHLRTNGVRISDPVREMGKVPFYLAYHDEDNLRILKTIVNTMLEACPELGSQHLYPRRQRNGRIRLGVVSANLKVHTIGKLNVGLLTSLPGDFELVVFRPSGQDDRITRKVDDRADSVIPLPKQLSAARECIGRSGCDLLFFPDLGMDPFTWFLAFARMAPVQMTTWGHPDTTGIPNVDVFLSSQWYEPELASSHYHERLVLSEELNPLYSLPEIPVSGDRASLGLPEDAHLYVFAQSLFKLHPDFDSVLRDILANDPKGKLVLLGGMHPEWTGRVRRRVAASSPSMADRILAVPHLPFAKFITLLRSADVVLDAPQFCGGNTTYEAFAAGVPVITQPGRFLRGRLTYGMYRRCGWEDLVAHDPQAYVQLAVRMATDREWRRACEAKVKESTGVLFDNRASAGAMCEIFRQLHQEQS
jgi:predicted O-linked N-acetylglucosamine transferase (SPINDLY family)